MNYREFRESRTELLRHNSELLDLGETNVYAALSHLSVPEPENKKDAQVHRCHLAQDWLRVQKLPGEFASRALVSAGVRDSLKTLFAHYASLHCSAWLPSDNYPVFHDLAQATGLEFEKFSTLGRVSLPTKGRDLLLLTNPMKPVGRYLSDGEVETLLSWLAVSPKRRLLLDTVYSLQSGFHPSTLRLLASGQTILLHSLTKGWLVPKCFGVCLVPEQDLSDLTGLFRRRAPGQDSLRFAELLLNKHATLPMRVGDALRVGQAKLLEALPKEVAESLQFDQSTPGYLHVSSVRTQNLREKYNILGIPVSVFGSGRGELTILSSLSLVSEAGGVLSSKENPNPVSIAE